ncbi:TPA: lpg2637 family Dot/Icm T4SS effector [Legionella pneumophila]
MFLTINDLQSQIQLAKKRLYVLAQNWLETQKEAINSKDKANWLDAFQASTKEEMQERLKETGFPLIRNATLVNQSEDDFSQESFEQSSSLINSENHSKQFNARRVPRVIYVCHSRENSEILKRLCQLTTLMEQLHTLEELTFEVQTNVQFRGLNLAYRMARSINKEWRDVEKGRETVAYYCERLQTAEKQYKWASDFCHESLAIYKEQLDARIMYFNESLNFFVECLADAFSSVKDDRYWLTRFLLSPLPWHNMLNEIACLLFTKNGFTNPTVDSIEVKRLHLKSITDRFANLMTEPFFLLEKELQTKMEKVDSEHKIARENLQAMTSELDILVHMQSQRELAALVFPAQPLSMLGFFQGIAAAMGRSYFYSTFVRGNQEHDYRAIEQEQPTIEATNYSNGLN